MDRPLVLSVFMGHGMMTLEHFRRNYHQDCHLNIPLRFMLRGQIQGGPQKPQSAGWPPLKEETPGLFKDFCMSIIRVSLQVSCIKPCSCLVLLSMSCLIKNLTDRHTAYFLILFWVNTSRCDKDEGILGLQSLP